MSSIFGIGVPKIVYGGNPLILHYSVLDPKFKEKIAKIFDSPIDATGIRTYKVKGYHATFTVMIHLHLYDSNPNGIAGLPNAKNMATALLALEDKDVTFYPFKDASSLNDDLGKYIKNSSNATVLCRLYDIQFDFLEKAGGRFDVCTLTILTNTFYDITKIII